MQLPRVSQVVIAVNTVQRNSDAAFSPGLSHGVNEKHEVLYAPGSSTATKVFSNSNAMKKLVPIFTLLICFAAIVICQTPVRKSGASTKKKVAPNRRPVVTDKAPKAIGPFSQAIVAGEFVFVAGQLGVDPKTGEFVGSGTVEQAEQELQNVSAVLEAAGSSLSHVVKTTVFLADMADFNAMNEVYRRHFPVDPPARSTVQVARLPRNARIEIEAIALVKH
jgi:2-iminobutanoate/2-iminopropanoate deaminase